LSLTKLFEKLLTTLLILSLFSIVPISHPSYAKNSAGSFDAKPGPILSEVVWSDNFDDENISDWQVFGVNYTSDPEYYLPAGYDNFSVAGGVLRAIGPEWSFAGHNSSVVYGTWSFDLDIQYPDGYSHFVVAFISEQFNEDWLTIGPRGEAYGLSFYPYDGAVPGKIDFIRASHDVGFTKLDTYNSPTNLIGWKNIIITRELSGQFYLYLDGTLIMESVNQFHTTSERFYFFGMANPGIDNITVSDTIDYDAAPPKWSPSLENKEIVLGESFYYDINATDHAEIDQYWIDDTQNFTIDNEGIITNITELVIGTYDVTVWVNDTLGNTQTGSFNLTVNVATTTTTTTPSTISSTTTTSITTTSTSTTEPPPTLIPPEILIAGIAAPILLIVVLVIWKSRK
jgi:hypothetical protein